MRRRSLSKSKRFEIFARDGFTCHYCGQQPPAVILQVDHINPVANGGDDDDLNLITSCQDCNLGKSAKVVKDIGPRPDADAQFLRIQQERVEAERYLEAKKERDAVFRRVVGELATVWSECLTENLVPSDRQWRVWFGLYAPQDIEFAIKKTIRPLMAGNFSGAEERVCDDCIRYVSGVLKRMCEEGQLSTQGE